MKAGLVDLKPHLHFEVQKVVTLSTVSIGMILVVPAAKFKKVQTILERCGEKAHTIGRVVKGEKRVTYQ